MRLCDIEGCGRKHFAFGYCATHRARWRRVCGPVEPGPVAHRNMQKRICTIASCGRAHHAKGMCRAHYKRVTCGLNMDSPMQKTCFSVKERLAEYSAPPDHNGCRIWTGSTNVGGYAIATGFDSKTVAAHRLAYSLAHGVKLKRWDIIHHICGNRACVEVTHLQKLTQAENTAEMMERRAYRERIKELESQVAELQVRLGLTWVSSLSLMVE